MNLNKRIESITERFNSAEEAGEFWDTHSAGDYWDEMEEVEMEFDVQKRTFLVPLDERIYRLAKKEAEEEHTTVKEIIDKVLERELTKIK